jgi:TRAP-type C4-dicarboxylate transport system permease small subunit
MSEQIRERGGFSVERILDALDAGLTYPSMFTVVIIMLLTSADALGRYLLNSPIIGAVEFTGEYLLVAAVFLAMAYTYQEGIFVRVTFFVSKLPHGVRFVLDHIVQAACALVCLVLLYATILQTLRIYASHTTTNSSLGYVLWPAYFIVALGLALLTLRVTADLLKVRRGRSALFKREKEIIPEE